MISKDTIQTIIETARIEEVVGDFVTLKKRGVNLIGLCPFHNEKTPSFTVSAPKGIYKCFGCGKAGNAVNFLMEHEHLSYPEALRHLAKKYFIEIEEEKQDAEQLQVLGEKESLFQVSAFAQQFFSKNLLETEEGKSIGLSYFKERGFDEKTIEKFQLGYSPESWDALTKAAADNGYKPEYLVNTGLTISKDNQHYDRFRSRVMFPIHNLSGRVIGFGGRILTADKNKPKYVNSPESEIYHKSNVLYGIFFAKNSIIANDNCFLVEGYTDVISLHMAGIENVVASSGTSLTTEQIRLIRRYTPNITILYDGDAAGIKASFRGIDMILGEGMNVKIVLFPDGEDPDSFARKNRPAEVRDFIQKNSTDFITFKTVLLVKETANDPIKRAGLIKEIVNTIAIIPDAILRSVYTKECSDIMKISEQTLINELNKLRRKNALHKSSEIVQEQELPEENEFAAEPQIEADIASTEYQEKGLILFMLNYGNQKINADAIDEDGEKTIESIELAKFILMDLNIDKIEFHNKVFQSIIDEYSKCIGEGFVPDVQYFVNHQNSVINSTVIELLFNNYILSDNWRKRHKISTNTEDSDLKISAMSYIYHLRIKIVDVMVAENVEQQKKSTNMEDIAILMNKYNILKKIRKGYTDKLSIVVG